MNKLDKGNNIDLQEDELSLKELFLIIIEWWKYFLSKWIIICLAGVIGVIAGFIYSYDKKPIYTAETTFVLEEDNGGGGMMGQLGGLAGLAGIDVGGGGGGLFQGDNIIQLYKSRSMIEKTLLSEVEYLGKKQLLIDYYIQFNNLRKVWNEKIELKNLNFELHQGEKFNRAQDSILGVMVKTINGGFLTISKPDKKLSIIKVEVKAQDEFFAKAFNDQIVQNVSDFYVQTKTKKAIDNLDILQHQTDSVRNVLNGAIYATAAVADATPNLNSTRQVLRAPALRSQFNAEANKAILTQLVQNLELAKLSLRKETPLIQIIDKPIFPLAKTKLSIRKALMIGGFIGVLISIIYLAIKKILIHFEMDA